MHVDYLHGDTPWLLVNSDAQLLSEILLNHQNGDWLKALCLARMILVDSGSQARSRRGLLFLIYLRQLHAGDNQTQHTGLPEAQELVINAANNAG